MRFDTTELGDVWTEICAYGTAVQAVPVTDAAKLHRPAIGLQGHLSPRVFIYRLRGWIHPYPRTSRGIW